LVVSEEARVAEPSADVAVVAEAALVEVVVA